MDENFSHFSDRGSTAARFRTWLIHIGLLVITFITAAIAGVLYPFGAIDTLPADDPRTFSEIVDFIISLPTRYGHLIYTAIHSLLTDPNTFSYGISFSASLLFILLCHEMGHYIACRIYKVDATLPFFIPTPPMIGPAGTFGAFIKITSPMPSRKAVFDIGVAGPIAGFIALIPISIIGIATMQTVSPEKLQYAGGIMFSDPLLSQIIAFILGVNLTYGVGNAFSSAAWVGLLVTALNLIPSGQLDGGHAIFAVFGKKIHRWTGRIAFILMALLSILGAYFFNSPSGFLIAILLGVMMRVKHPEPWDTSPIGAGRTIVAILTLLIFILCFTPFPIKIL